MRLIYSLRKFSVNTPYKYFSFSPSQLESVTIGVLWPRLSHINNECEGLENRYTNYIQTIQGGPENLGNLLGCHSAEDWPIITP